jgi:hypothetical protein
MLDVKGILSALFSTFPGSAAAREVDEELQFHIDMRIAENIAQGMTQEDARADALRRFGDIERLKQECLTIDRGNISSPMRWLVRFVVVTGLVFWASKAPQTINVLGQMIVIIVALGLLLNYVGSKSPSTSHSDLNGSRVSIRRLQLPLVITLVLLTILSAGMAVVAFSMRFGI